MNIDKPAHRVINSIIAKKQLTTAPSPSGQARLPALVVGFAIHGLAVTRALARHGVTVHALSDISAVQAPTSRTSYCTVHFKDGLNSGQIADHLLEVAAQIGSAEKIVLFPTSDRIAQGISASWDRLSERFLLSWSHCRDLVMQLQRKDLLASYCDRAGIRYPRSRILQEATETGSISESLQFPLVVKPARPLSSFKAIQVSNHDELDHCVLKYQHDLPFVVQEWIEGPEPSLYSCTGYVVRGEPLYLFTSRKIDASPRGTGQGTVFQTYDHRLAREITIKFLHQLDLSGPIAVEFKRDIKGDFWFIEPNVGRTEYCVDLAVQSGFNLPMLEYLHVTGGDWKSMIPDQTEPCTWFDTDKDPTCFLRNLHALAKQNGQRRRAVFPFIGHGDRGPVIASLCARAMRPFDAVGRRLKRSFGRTSGPST
jgi:predicted ATP-grasp superfamily ATP-dependent carboligase